MNNGSKLKGTRASRHRRPSIWYFDRLPPSARAALADAAFLWSPGTIYSRWKKGTPGFKTGADCAARIREWDARQIARENKQRGVAL